MEMRDRGGNTSECPRALVVSHQYWPTPGAASQVIGALVRELVRQGFHVTVLTNAARPGPRSTYTGPHGEQVEAVAGPETSGVSLRRVIDLAQFARAVLRRGRRDSFDVVISDAPPTAAWAASLTARKQDSPFVYYFSDSWVAASAGSRGLAWRLANRVLSKIEGSALARSRLTIAVTDEMSEIAIAAGARNVVEVPNGIDTAELARSNETWYPHGAERPFFLYAGNAGFVHGAEVFVDAAEILWTEGLDFDLVFFGYGSGHVYAESAHKRWGDRIVVMGNQPAELVAAAYRGSVGALSSLRPIPSYAHARPMKSLTGAACGTPAVFVGVGDFAEVIRDNELGFVSQWAPEDAAEVMKLALELHESDDCTAKRVAIRDYAAENFDERDGAARVVDAIQKLVSEVRG